MINNSSEEKEIEITPVTLTYCPSIAPLSSVSGCLLTLPHHPLLPHAQFQINPTNKGTKTAPTATKITAFLTATIKKAPTSNPIKSTTITTHTTGLETLSPTFTSSAKLVTADP
jgi:hypothetical protein